jgi:hypothetical protein
VESCSLEDWEGYQCQLRIPNHEVLAQYRSIFRRQLAYRLGGQSLYQPFLTSLFQADKKAIIEYLQRYLLNTVSSHDLAGNLAERFYHGLILGLVAGLQEHYVIHSNKESGYGRYDILIFPKPHVGKVALLLELKYSSAEKNLSEYAQQALQQINAKHYQAELAQQDHISELIKMGWAFSGKQVAIERQAETV